MSNNDPHINEIIVIFTSTFITIENATTSLSDPCIENNKVCTDEHCYLKLRITPTKNGKDIQSIDIYYSDPNSVPSHINEKIDDEFTFRSLFYSTGDIGESLLERIVTYMRSLPPDEVSVIIKEYEKYIENGVILDGLIAGIAAYMAFLFLNENSVFMNQMPFQFGSPWMVNSGNIVNRNMFQYLSLPLTSLAKVSHDVLLQLILFIQSFINIWDPLFIDGPVIGSSNEARLCVEIISGFSQHISSLFAETISQNSIMVKQIHSVEDKLQSYIDSAISRMHREVHNLILDTKRSTKELVDDINKQLNFTDDTVKEKKLKLIESNLTDRINEKIQTELDASYESIKDISHEYSRTESEKQNTNLTTRCNKVGSKIRCGCELCSHIVVVSTADPKNLTNVMNDRKEKGLNNILANTDHHIEISHDEHGFVESRTIEIPISNGAKIKIGAESKNMENISNCGFTEGNINNNDRLGDVRITNLPWNRRRNNLVKKTKSSPTTGCEQNSHPQRIFDPPEIS
jgi:hypothetical protein